MVDSYKKVELQMVLREAVRATLSYFVTLRGVEEWEVAELCNITETGEVLAAEDKYEPTVEELQRFLENLRLSWEEFFEVLWIYQVTGESPKTDCAKSGEYYSIISPGEEDFVQQKEPILSGAAELRSWTLEEEIPFKELGREADAYPIPVPIEAVFGREFAKKVRRVAFGRGNLAASPYI